MKKTVKTVSIILIAALLLSACGSKQEEPVPVQEPAVTTVPVVVPSAPAGNDAPQSQQPDPTPAPEPDTEPPRIIVNPYTFFYTDEAPAYFSVITVTDNVDAPEDIKLEIDKQWVEPDTVGDYEVTYTATDSSGNSSTAKAKLHFRKRYVSEEDLEAAAQNVLAKIITDDMTTEQQAYAIFKYVYNTIVYKTNGNKYGLEELNVPVDSDHRELEAYKGLTQGYGNCFTYYAAAYVLLSHIDCEILSCERVGHDTHHYWLLINLGSGWYNFDACSGSDMNTKVFMRTTAELHEINDYYWKIDETRYPELATEPYEFADDSIRAQVMR